MKTIPRALVWELHSHGKWLITFFFAVSHFLPFLLYSALSHIALPNLDDPAMIMSHLTMAGITFFVLSVGIHSAFGPPSRLYAMPISNFALVQWHLLVSGILSGIGAAISTLLLNRFCHIGWPLLGPALFTVTANCAIRATWMVFGKSAWGCVALGAVLFPLILWLHSRYGGSLFAQPDRYWTEVTPLEVLTMITIVFLSFPMAVWGIARDRSGQSLPELGIIRSLQRLWERISLGSSSSTAKFRSPEEAHFWYEWNQKGLAFALIILLVGSMIGLLYSLSWLFGKDMHDGMAEIHKGLLAIGLLLTPLATAAGFVFGVSHPNQETRRRESDVSEVLIGQHNPFVFGHFLSTRPISDLTLSKISMKVAALSLFLGWALWAIVFGIFVVFAWSCGRLPTPLFPEELGYWYLPLTLLGPYVVALTVMAIELTGRMELVKILVFGGIAAMTGILCIHNFCLDEKQQEIFAKSVFVLFVAVILLGIAIAYWKVNRERWVDRRSIGIGGGIFLGLVTLGWALKPSQESEFALSYMIVMAGLAAAPWATIPLAIRWNRHR